MALFYLVFITPLNIVVIIGINTECNIIYYDEDKKIVYRKGFLLKYGKKIQIDTIQNVLLLEVTHPKLKSKNFVILDSKDMNSNFFSKEHSLSFEYNRNSRIFVKRFWNKPVKVVYRHTLM